MRTLFRCLALMANIIYLFPTVAGHSWVEEATVISPNGTFIGPKGYPRKYVQRGMDGFKDDLMMHRLPPNDRQVTPGSPTPQILPTDNMCKDSQVNPVQSEGKPRLKAHPGAPIALIYLENGHVSMPDNPLGKPPGSGKVSVYGTTDPKPDDKIKSIHNVWNKEGTGGDRRGMLLSVQNYDDTRCHQIVANSRVSKERRIKFPNKNNGVDEELRCQHDLALPQNAPVGKPYTLYWVWDWETLPNIDPNLMSGKQETYTSCLDIDIVEPANGLKKAVQGQPPALKAVDAGNYADSAIPAQFNNLKAPMIPGLAGAEAPPPNPEQQPKPATQQWSSAPPADSTSPPEKESEPQPNPAGDDCGGVPSTSVKATQTPAATPSNSKPAIIPLSPPKPSPTAIASPDSTPTGNNGGLPIVVVVTPGSFGESNTVTPSPTTTMPTTPPEPSATPVAFSCPEDDASPSPQVSPLPLSNLDPDTATAITATTPSPSPRPDAVATPGSPPLDPTRAPDDDDEEDTGVGVDPVTIGPDGSVLGASPSAPAPCSIVTVTATVTVTPDVTAQQPAQSTDTAPEPSSAPAIIPLPARVPNNGASTDSSSNLLQTTIERSLPAQDEDNVSTKTETVTAATTVFVTLGATPTAEAQAQFKSSETTPPAQPSGFALLKRQSSPSPATAGSPSTSAEESDYPPLPDQQASAPTSSAPSPPPSKRGFKTLSSRFRGYFREVQADQ